MGTDLPIYVFYIAISICTVTLRGRFKMELVWYPGYKDSKRGETGRERKTVSHFLFSYES